MLGEQRLQTSQGLVYHLLGVKAETGLICRVVIGNDVQLSDSLTIAVTSDLGHGAG